MNMNKQPWLFGIFLGVFACQGGAQEADSTKNIDDEEEPLPDLPVPACGDGNVDENEECDDGNFVENDTCTNMCLLPKCGDSIVQASETCDDGGLDPDDGCTPLCHDRGTVIMSYSRDDLAEAAQAVVLDSKNNIMILGKKWGESRLIKYTPDFDPQWDTSVLISQSLAFVSDNAVLVGGIFDGRGHAQQIDAHTGEPLWFEGTQAPDSVFSWVTAAGWHTVSAGHQETQDGQTGLLVRHNKSGKVVSTVKWEEGSLGPAVVDHAGWVWVIGNAEVPKLRGYNLNNDASIVRPLDPGIYKDIVQDKKGNLYLLAHTEDASSFTVVKFEADGHQLHQAWPVQMYAGAAAYGLAVLPGETFVVAGTLWDNGDANGLLVWFNQTTGQYEHEVLVGTPNSFEVFEDVAVAPDGSMAVAVGARGLAWDKAALWAYSFEI